MRNHIRRRSFLTLLGGAAAVWPLAASAQQDGRVQRIGILIYGAADDPNSQANATSIRGGLSKLGWIEGRNLRIDLRFTGGDLDAIRADAERLVNLAPDVIVTHTGPVTQAVRLKTRNIPIVLVAVGDPVANGYVTNLARPEGNITGFTNLFFSVAGKWVELLKDVMPRLERVAFIYNSDFTMQGYWEEIETAGSRLSVRTSRNSVGSDREIERVIQAISAEPHGGLILGIQPNGALRELISQLAIRNRLPTIYNERSAMPESGLMSYGPSRDEMYGRGVPFYVDRILRGAQPSELPVQFPTKFDLVVNLKTAKAIGLTIPETFLVRADEVIE